MINIPLNFWQMEIIMILGILTNILARVNRINQQTDAEIPLNKILGKFFRKEIFSYGMSLIITGITAYAFVYMKQFEKPTLAEVREASKYVIYAVFGLYAFGIVNQYLFYMWLGRIQSKTGIDIDIIKKD